MPEFSLTYEMSDALITQAVREDCVAVAREHVSLRDLLVVAGSAGVFVLAIVREGHWLWWLAGLAPLIFALLGLGWLLAWLWLPRSAIGRLAHLPHRRVQVDASDTALTFQTATEKLEVNWLELKALTRRPHFWLFCLRAGPRIPVPSTALSADAVALLEAKLAAREQSAGKAT